MDELKERIKFHWDFACHYLKYKWRNKKEKYSNPNPIPKIIHYAWFGRNEYSDTIKKCMASWDKLSGYEFKLWNEDNFPIEQYPFAQQAYAEKRYAMVSDVARLHALYHEGGIYLDTDIEIFKSFDPLLNNDGFICFQSKHTLMTVVIAAKPKHPWIKLLLSWYQYMKWHPIYRVVANTKIISRLTKAHYVVKFRGKEVTLKDGIKCLPAEYFNPVKGKTENTYACHHEEGQWEQIY